eukprot:Skav232873  [mRNA]  locus=scaffold1432:928:2037:- [translate_table: standard]
MASRSRLGPDPRVQVCALPKKLWEVTQRQGCMDIHKILHSTRDQKWKSAPDSEWLGGDGLADLMSSLFSLHTNGVLQGSKLKKALLKLQSEKGRMNFTRLHDSDWCDKMDELIRIAAGQYRSAKQDAVKYGRLVRKASVKEKKNIDMVLGFMVLSEEEMVTGGVAPAGGPDEPAQVEAKGEAMDNALVVAKPEPSSTSIFHRVLKREASDPASPSFGLNTGQAKASKSSSSWEKPSVSKANNLAELELAEDEQKELMNWMTETSQVEKKQNQKGAKKKKKQQTEKTSGTLQKTEKKSKQKVATKPCLKQQKPAATHKTSFLHRATSAAYHKARTAAKKLGKSPEEALQAAREALKKTKEDIQAGLLKES